jgi:hypothetical protein
VLVVPLQAVAAQSVNVFLGGQACVLTVRQFDTGLYFTLQWSSPTVSSGQLNGVLCLNAVRIVRDLYFGFVGDFAFFDTQPDPIVGAADPDYTGLADRFVLMYLTPTDLDGAG